MLWREAALGALCIGAAEGRDLSTRRRRRKPCGAAASKRMQQRASSKYDVQIAESGSSPAQTDQFNRIRFMPSRQRPKRSQKFRIISGEQNRLRFSHAVGMPESSP
jgi:hypothetical protein